MMKNSIPEESALFSQRRVLKQTKPVSLLIPNVLRNDAVKIFFPRRVLIDKAISSRLVAGILNFENSSQQLANY